MIKDGCKMSPVFFVLIMNDSAKWKDKMKLLLYADDAILIADTEEKMRMKINTRSAWHADKQQQE